MALKVKNLILGAGISGLSQAYFLGHKNCLILEKSIAIGGHCRSHRIGTSTWDEGPHVSFTANPLVLGLFKESVSQQYETINVDVANYWYGHWIPHPVQMYLAYLPSAKRDECLRGYLDANARQGEEQAVLSNYAEWVEYYLGEGLSKNFVEKYTKKYWQCSPAELSTDWIGPRMKVPEKDEVIRGAKGRLTEKHHYVQQVIYPSVGGFQSFLNKIADNANVIFNSNVVNIDLQNQFVETQEGEKIFYERLVSTIPLSIFVSYLADLPPEVEAAAKSLKCTSLSLVNLTTRKSPTNSYHWFYVYDDDMVSTRVTQQHLLSPKNLRDGLYGYQVEVYHPPLQRVHPAALVERVIRESRQIGFVDDFVSYNYQFVPYANVIPSLARRRSVDRIFSYLASFGLSREPNDTSPINILPNEADRDSAVGSIIMVGRYAQCTYGWTDDCVLRSSYVSNRIALGSSRH